MKILAFAGSSRQGSFNKKLVRIAAQAARDAGAEVTLVDLRDFPMPIYDGDLEESSGLPPEAQRLRDLFLAHQGLLIASPEYNSSITGLLKNTIDWVSRPWQDQASLAALDNKVAALVSASPGALGGMRSLVVVRTLLTNLGVLVLPDQQAVPRAHEAFDENGQLKDARARESVQRVGRLLAIATREFQPYLAQT